MIRLRSWGSLLWLSLGLLIWYGWAQLGVQSSNASLQRYKEWSAGGSNGFSDLSQFYLKRKRPAEPGDVTLPPVPAKSGIKSWAIQADTTVLINLDARIEGRPVQLRFVPIVRSPRSIRYDCVSDTPQIYVREFCYAESLKSPADVAAQLAENAQTLAGFPDVVTASGSVLPRGTSVGSVVVVSAQVSDLNHCGYQCVKQENCLSSRPLACSKIVVDGNTRWFEIVSSGAAVRASDFATRTAADQACEQALGTGYKVLMASSITGLIKLGASAEYWVHDEMRVENNCWSADYR